MQVVSHHLLSDRGIERVKPTENVTEDDPFGVSKAHQIEEVILQLFFPSYRREISTFMRIWKEIGHSSDKIGDVRGDGDVHITA